MPAEKSSCPAERTLALIAGGWKLMVIHWLLEGPMRFNELQRRLGPITHRILANTLREMEAGSLLLRHDFQEMPLRVEYSLTKKGASLVSILIAMEKWAVENPDA